MEEVIKRNGNYSNFFSNKYVRNFGLMLFLLAIGFLVPVLIGLGKSGFAESKTLLQTFTFYQNFIYAGLIFIAVAWVFLILLAKFKGDKHNFQSVMFASQGELPSASSKLKFMKNVSNTQLFLISFIIAGIALLFNLTRSQQIMFSGVTTIGQQFTAIDNTIFNSALIPIAENLGAHIMIVIACIIMVFLDRRYNIDDDVTILSTAALGVFLYTVYGIVNHIMRYGSSGYYMLAVGVFWFVIGLITVLTGSIIPGIVIHLVNNLFIELKTYFSSSSTPIIVGFVLFLLVILYLRIYVFKGAKKK